jgi:hypothetical protein
MRCLSAGIRLAGILTQCSSSADLAESLAIEQTLTGGVVICAADRWILLSGFLAVERTSRWRGKAFRSGAANLEVRNDDSAG